MILTWLFAGKLTKLLRITAALPSVAWQGLTPSVVGVRPFRAKQASPGFKETLAPYVIVTEPLVGTGLVKVTSSKVSRLLFLVQRPAEE